jgi:hypothetical protein
MVRILVTVIALAASFTGGLWAGIAYTDSTNAAAPTPAPTVIVDETTEPESTPRPAPTPYTGEVLAFGDFFLLSTAPCLEEKGFEVDAQAGRRVTDAASELSRLGDDIPGAVLLHLGANGGAAPADLERIMSILGPDRIVVWSTIQLPDDDRYTFEDATNAAISALPLTYPNARIVSWNALSLTNPTWLNADGSLTPAGCEAFAGFAETVVRAAI